ncbi:MAG: hypothetical protein LAO79_03545 [Acidobacteriia bacterium]|nr:hypothetical protein [Terriglobia bacterium]
MRNTSNNALLIAAAVALLAVLAWGLEQAAVAPLQTGDVYPPFSSLRSDPLGAKALYESLAALPSVEVERLYKQRTVIGSRDTMLVLGVEPVSWSAIQNRTLEGYEKLVADGGRLVIAFLPVRTSRRMAEKRAVEERWNVKLRYADRKEEDDSAIPRETSLFFEAGPEWRAIASHNAVERAFGKGSIVLAADTFSLSNEGLREARDAAFMASLIGPSARVIFDENHFGVVESGSVTKLMRKYHLEGAVVILAIAAALFLWRSASSFLPPREAAARDTVAGRDSTEGMAALLHRGVAEKDLLDTCFAEWSASAPRRAARVEEELRRFKHDPVAAYRAASRALTEKT